MLSKNKTIKILIKEGLNKKQLNEIKKEEVLDAFKLNNKKTTLRVLELCGFSSQVKHDLGLSYALWLDFVENKKQDDFDSESGYYTELSRLSNSLSSLSQVLGVTKSTIVSIIPNDLEESQKGQIANWLKRQVLKDKVSYDNYINWSMSASLGAQRNFVNSVKGNLERFYQMNRFIEQPYRDINRIEDFNQLAKVVQNAEPAYQAYLDKKQNLDAGKGTEKIYEDSEFTIFIPHNKGAACELGKGTQWCTAAPGLDYYNYYHKENDPLFVIWKKPQKEGVPLMKFQFHYGTGQFMNAADHPILDDEPTPEFPDQKWNKDLFLKIHNIILSTVGDRFPILKSSVKKVGDTFATEERSYISRNDPDANDFTLNVPYGIRYHLEGNQMRENAGENPARISITYTTPHYLVIDFVWTQSNKTPPSERSTLATTDDYLKGKKDSPAKATIWIHENGEIILKQLIWRNNNLRTEYTPWLPQIF